MSNKKRKLGRPPTVRRSVITATEKLLEFTPLYRLSVSQICVESGVSRQAFYNHFDSPTAVVEIALDEYTPEFAEAISPLLNRSPEDDLDQVLTRSLENWAAFAAAHRYLLRTYLAEFHRNESFHRKYMRLLNETIRKVSLIIAEERLRTQNLSPQIDESMISAVIMLGFERTRLAVLTGSAPALGSLDGLIDPLRVLFIGALSVPDIPK